ncbi:MAG TPA: glycosyltransferase family 1 protein [Bryobacteraceae bacterium]|nr:glycosyltransferase family 1 protein [Bryobacteraceae bacterium]
MAPLRIGVNALYLIPGGVGGTEIYLRCLLAALAQIDPVNRYFLFTNKETGADVAPSSPAFTLVPQQVRASFRPARILWEQTMLPLAAARLGIDVMLNPGFTAPVYCPCPAVTVFHDLQHQRHPEYFRWYDLPFWRLLLYCSVHLAGTVVAISEATAADLRRFYRLPESRIKVVPIGVDPVFFEIGRRLRPEPLLLAVSTLHPHKNLDGLLRAFAAFRRKHREFRLVLAGMRGFYTAELERLRDELNLAGAVEFTGWIPREDLYELYARAFAFIYPSRFEGFGMPVMEALASGIPTACSDIEPLRECAGEAALRFDPGDTRAIAGALERLVCDHALRDRLAAAGPVRAALYGWESSARAILNALTAAATGAR